jgi:hypothetical protein
MRVRTHAASGLLAAGVFILGTSTPAAADWDNGNPPPGTDPPPSTGGGIDGNKLDAQASDTQIVTTRSGGSDGSGGTLTTRPGTAWTPPVCWYEPYMTPQEFEAEVERLEREGGMGRLATNSHGTVGVFTDIYRDNDVEDWFTSEPGYDDYNLDLQGEGMWWVGVINSNREDEFTHGVDCTRDIYWADFTESPEQETITPELLAEYAYDEITVPETRIKLSPSGRQKVNLPTWIWMDAERLEPVTVRAALPGTGIWAQTTAEPVALTLEAGTDEAAFFPPSARCPVQNGRIGEPYTRGRSEDDPPCGLVYERATHSSGSFELKASLTWEVSWRGSDGNGGELPEGVFETTRNVVVQEVQTIVR